MIEIEVIHKDGSKSLLAVSPETSIQLESTSPFFDDKDTEDTYSYPLDLPWCEQNRKALSAPEMLTSVRGKEQPFWRVNVKDNGITELADAKMTLLKFSGTHSGDTGTYTVAISGGISMYGSMIKDKSLRSLSLGGKIIFPLNHTSRMFAYNVMTGAELRYPYIAFAPVKREGYIDTSRSDYSVEYLYDETVNSIVRHSAYPRGWIFGSLDQTTVTPTNTGYAANPGSSYYKGHRTVPFFNLQYVFRKCFEEYGYSVYGSFFEDEDYKHIYLDNNFGLEIYNSGNTDINKSITPKNHVPDITLAEYINAVKQAFGLMYILRGDKRVEVIYRDTLLSTADVTDLTELTTDYFEAELPDVQSSGLKISFNWPGDDQLVADLVKRIDPERVRVSIQNITTLPTVNPPFVDNDLMYVIDRNKYYWYYNNGTPQPHTWYEYSLGFEDFLLGNGQNHIELALCPLLPYDPEQFTGNHDPYELIDNVGIRQKGTYFNQNRVLVENEFGLRMFYIKPYDIPTQGGIFPACTGYPMSFVNAINSRDGSRRVRTGLSLTAPDGLVKRHHLKWYKTLIYGLKVKAYFLLAGGRQHLLNYEKKIRIRESLYVLQKKSAPLGKDALTEATLVKISSGVYE